MNYREKMREYLKEPNQLSSQYGKWCSLNKEQRQMITRLLDEMDRADIYIKNLFLKNEAYESMIKEAINYIENTDDFDIEIFNESTGGCLGTDLSNGAKNLLNILKKVGDSNE